MAGVVWSSFSYFQGDNMGLELNLWRLGYFEGEGIVGVHGKAVWEGIVGCPNDNLVDCTC